MSDPTMSQMRKSILTTVAAVVCLSSQIVPLQGADGGPWSVDFRFSPPEWQTAICLPDDPQKSLVDRSGELLYHYGQGGREFATRIGVEVAGDASGRSRNCLRRASPSCGRSAGQRVWRSWRKLLPSPICGNRKSRAPRTVAASRCGRRESELGTAAGRNGSFAPEHRSAHGRKHPLPNDRADGCFAARGAGAV